MSDKGLKTSYSFRPRQDEAEEIKEFLMKQSNFGDAIRYLIEKEILENGIRDMSKHIPAKRDVFSPGRKETKVKVDIIGKSKDKENVPKDIIKRENTEMVHIDKQSIEDIKTTENEHNKSTMEHKEENENFLFVDEAMQEKSNEIAVSEDEINKEKEKETVSKFECKYSVDIPSCYD